MLRVVVKYAFLFILIGYLILGGNLDWDAAGIFFSAANIGVLVFLLFVFVLFVSLIACRQCLFGKFIRADLSFWQSMRIALVATFSANFLPGEVGSDIARVYMLKSAFQREYAPVLGVVMADRLIGLWGLAPLALMSSLLLGDAADESRAYFHILSCLCGLLTVMPACLFALKRKWLEKAFSCFARGRPFPRKIDDFLLALQKMGSDIPTFFLLYVLVLIGHIAGAFGLAALAEALYGSEAFWPAFLLRHLIGIVTVIPVSPGNLGWTETVGQIAFSVVGLSGGATVLAVWRMIWALFSLSGGFLYLSRP